jgi:hypothetical protein
MVPGTNLRFPKIGARHHFLGVFCAFVVLTAYVVCCSLGRNTHGFVAYYGAARLLIAGELGPEAYSDEWFTAYVQRITASEVIEVFRPNPPTMALMAVPVAFLRPLEARAAWLFASLAALAVGVAALLKWARPPETALAIAVVLIVLLNPAVVANLRTGQAYLFVFAALTGVALALARGRDVVAGSLLGTTLALKATGVPLFLLLIVRRRARAVAAATIVATILVALVTPFIGNDMWRRYPAEVRAFLERPAASATGYQTTRSLLRRLCIADPQWNPAPAADCPALADVVPPVLIAAALVLTAVASTRSATAPWIAAALCLSVLVQPVAGEPPYVLLGIALWLVLSAGGAQAPPLRIGLAFAALFLVPLEYTAQRFTDGWSALAGYPRVYAAWLLWGLAIWAMLRRIGHPRAATQSHVPDAP